jgi:hypothetical protein
MSTKPINLVRYAGDYWVTLADYTRTRNVDGYSDHSSVKSAIRTFVVKKNPDKYIAFRGEAQLKNIVQENKSNPLFNPEDFQGTRTALIHFSMISDLDGRFSIDSSYKEIYSTFLQEAEKVISSNNTNTTNTSLESEVDSILGNRSVMIMQLRQELNRLDKEIELRQSNREKVMQAINAIESLEIEDL